MEYSFVMWLSLWFQNVFDFTLSRLHFGSLIIRNRSSYQSLTACMVVIMIINTQNYINFLNNKYISVSIIVDWQHKRKKIMFFLKNRIRLVKSPYILKWSVIFQFVKENLEYFKRFGKSLVMLFDGDNLDH